MMNLMTIIYSMAKCISEVYFKLPHLQKLQQCVLIMVSSLCAIAVTTLTSF